MGGTLPGGRPPDPSCRAGRRRRQHRQPGLRQGAHGPGGILPGAGRERQEVAAVSGCQLPDGTFKLGFKTRYGTRRQQTTYVNVTISSFFLANLLP